MNLKEIIVKGRDYISGLPRSITINTNEIVTAIDDELRQIIDAIKSCPPGYSP